MDDDPQDDYQAAADYADEAAEADTDPNAS
jgi:hypothetical protein